MRWTERQRAMLREMGIHLWAPDSDEAAPAAATASIAAAADTASPPSRVAPSAAVPPSHASSGAASAGPAESPVATRGADAPIARTPAAVASAQAPRLPGLAPADWLVVGEPLDAADPQQEQLLDNLLRAIGVGLVAPGRERRAAFRALDGNAGADGGAGAPSGSPRGGLQAAIETVAPRCVLALGRAAAAALLGDDVPLGGLRGRVHQVAGVPVVVTFSLAFLLRHPAEKAKAWADLCLAVGTLAAAPA